eukprot:scaffold14707_cov176-Ochromonas_danica.AAC.7
MTANRGQTVIVPDWDRVNFPYPAQVFSSRILERRQRLLATTMVLSDAMEVIQVTESIPRSLGQSPRFRLAVWVWSDLSVSSMDKAKANQLT